MPKPPDKPDPESRPAPQDPRYEEFLPELRAFFARRSANGDGEELVQEVYERLLKYRPKEPLKDPRRYVFMVAHNVLRASRALARKNSQRYVVCTPAEIEGRVETLSRLWILEDGGPEIAAEEIDRVLEQLPRVCRIAILRQRRDGWTYQQIAEELGVSDNTVKGYLTQVFNHFRIYFSEQGR